MTAVLIKLVETDLIIPYEKNAKKHPATQVEQIAKSISNFGFNVPILVDKANVIVTGHARYLAAQKLNLKQVPVAVLEKLTPEQIKKFRLSDNKVAESKWNEVLLIEDLQELR
jgi:ParB-like chromosome segregation protein Spo0J